MSELKPCPFCGGEAEIVYARSMMSHTEIRCACGASVSVMDEDPAIAAWNTRPESLALTAAVQGEREACARIADVHRGCHAPKVINFDLGADLTGRGIAAAIRSRGPAPAGDVITEDFAVTMKTIAAVYEERDRVMAVVREYVEAWEAITNNAATFGAEELKRKGHAWLALRALVDGKGESNARETIGCKPCPTCIGSGTIDTGEACGRCPRCDGYGSLVVESPTTGEAKDGGAKP